MPLALRLSDRLGPQAGISARGAPDMSGKPLDFRAPRKRGERQLASAVASREAAWAVPASEYKSGKCGGHAGEDCWPAQALPPRRVPQQCEPHGRAVWRQGTDLPMRGLTFELSGRRRQDARPGLAKMYRVPPDRAWWPAVGAPLERGVRPHSSAAATNPSFYLLAARWSRDAQASTI